MNIIMSSKSEKKIANTKGEKKKFYCLRLKWEFLIVCVLVRYSHLHCVILQSIAKNLKMYKKF